MKHNLTALGALLLTLVSLLAGQPRPVYTRPLARPTPAAPVPVPARVAVETVETTRSTPPPSAASGKSWKQLDEECYQALEAKRSCDARSLCLAALEAKRREIAVLQDDNNKLKTLYEGKAEDAADQERDRNKRRDVLEGDRQRIQVEIQAMEGRIQALQSPAAAQKMTEESRNQLIDASRRHLAALSETLSYYEQELGLNRKEIPIIGQARMRAEAFAALTAALGETLNSRTNYWTQYYRALTVGHTWQCEIPSPPENPPESKARSSAFLGK